MGHRFPIPHIYRSFVQGSEQPVDLYYKFAAAYFRKNYHEYEVIEFDKDSAICRLKTENN